MGLIKTLRFITRHPLARINKRAALVRWLRWQLGSRILGWPVAVPFVDDSRLLVKPGMTGATGNIYCGLHEFEDMAFVLHFLREGDLFVDVGANIGSYTILAATTGSDVIAFEPVPETYDVLLDNIQLNRCVGVSALNKAVGGEEGTLVMSVDRDTTNQVLDVDELYQGETANVEQVTLDSSLGLQEPILIKIDVEGFEAQVLRGGLSVLKRDSLCAVIMELNGSGAKYGGDDSDMHQTMVALGFTPCTYSPFTRSIMVLADKPANQGNTLYLRDLVVAKERVEKALRYRTLDIEL